MIVDIQDAGAVAEVEELMARFGLSAEAVIERVILEAGCWMPMETLADTYWQNKRKADSVDNDIPSWHRLVKKLPIFTKNWDLKIINDPPHFELTHISGFTVSLSVYDRWAALWEKAPGLIFYLSKLRCGPTTYAPPGFSKTPSQRQSLITQARKIVVEIDPLSIMIGREKDIVCEYIAANPTNCPDIVPEA
ncbi:hypothetical protein [Edaphobacter dinghuensis]|uniref:Uncharacterized protein n=1 Tax=Edaphobacter dinghuensis TaxID=1560005 RepID=A0A917HAE0_9BACT|nr:hypothetical protein [Edaphobacter dinghuensis]GGG72722.1 hypothetical protein GCM10011585_13980 [Edaphobacter dinghuensis]